MVTDGEASKRQWTESATTAIDKSSTKDAKANTKTLM